MSLIPAQYRIKTPLVPSLDCELSMKCPTTAMMLTNHRFDYLLISHFLLDLQEADRSVLKLDPNDPLHSSRDPYDSTPSFISSIGAFISPHLPLPPDHDSEWRENSRSDMEEREGKAEIFEDSQGATSSSCE